jgi:hypothetical protein
LQELGDRCGSGSVHGRAHRHLDSFQVETAGLAVSLEDHA